MVPDAAQCNQIERAVAARFHQIRQTVVKPGYLVREVQSLSGFTQFLDRLYRQNIMAAFGKPGGIATGAAANIRDAVGVTGNRSMTGA